MPIIVTYELEDFKTATRNRIQSMFERLGWESLGGSSYRYPRLGSKHPTEDWFNHVVPALMLFRTMVLAENKPIKKFTLDAQSSTGFNKKSKFGTQPLLLAKNKGLLYEPQAKHFGKKNLINWISEIKSPY